MKEQESQQKKLDADQISEEIKRKIEDERRKQWLSGFSERERKEIEFCILYESKFSHGTDGHNAKVIIAKMAKLLDSR